MYDIHTTRNKINFTFIIIPNHTCVSVEFCEGDTAVKACCIASVNMFCVISGCTALGAAATDWFLAAELLAAGFDAVTAAKAEESCAGVMEAGSSPE